MKLSGIKLLVAGITGEEHAIAMQGKPYSGLTHHGATKLPLLFLSQLQVM